MPNVQLIITQSKLCFKLFFSQGPHIPWTLASWGRAGSVLGDFGFRPALQALAQEEAEYVAQTGTLTCFRFVAQGCSRLLKLLKLLEVAEFFVHIFVFSLAAVATSQTELFGIPCISVCAVADIRRRTLATGALKPAGVSCEGLRNSGYNCVGHLIPASQATSTRNCRTILQLDPYNKYILLS